MIRHRHSSHPATPHLLVALAVLSLTIPFNAKPAQACDACNLGLLQETLGERGDTAIGRDIIAAAMNQRGLPLPGFSDLQGRSEQIIADHLAANRTAASDTLAAAAADNIPVPRGNPGVVGPGEFDRERVLERDARLDIPLTSYVDQSVEADHRVELSLTEGRTYLGNGVMYEGFLMNGSLPGPTIVVEEGDVVEFVVTNTGAIPHGASLHAAYTQTSAFLGKINPGQTKSLKFRASYPGVFMYHCAPGGHAIPVHVMAGQYGMMVVKPKQTQYRLEQELGHEPDLEIFLLQHEVYASGKDAVEGVAAYTMFNGRLFRYVEEPIVARPGDFVRIYFLNVGPNLLSTFHIVGIIWDFAYWQGNPDMAWPGGQTVTAGPSDSWVVEFRVPPAEGAYTMLSHAVGSTSRGAIGLIVAQEDAAEPQTVLADGPTYTQEELGELAAEANRTLAPFGIGTAEADRPVRHTDPTQEVFVRIVGNSFHPKVLEVPPGTKVTWVNDDVFTYLAGEFSGAHNVVTINAPAPFGSPILLHAQTFSHTFSEVGDYEYMCVPHPYMRGKVKVYEPVEVEVIADGSLAGGWHTGSVVVIALLMSLVAVLGTTLFLARKR